MPNRVLRDWTDSKSVNRLSAEAECLFIRLIQKADDYGRFYGDVKMIKLHCFPLKNYRNTDISRWMTELIQNDLIVVYNGAVSGNCYTLIRKFNQRIRAKGTKFIDLPENTTENDTFDSCLSHDGHVTDKERKKENSPHSPYKEKKREYNYNTSHAEKKYKIFFDYEGDSKIHGISREQLNLWHEAYPAIDVEGEIRQMSAWLDANRTNRKYDIKRFIVAWLKRSQDRAPIVKNINRQRKLISPISGRELTSNEEFEI